MYMFIIEEAIQSGGMAVYLLYKSNRYEDALKMAQWLLDNLINPALDFVRAYGHAAYPLNMCYETFYTVAKRNMETYIDLCRRKLEE